MTPEELEQIKKSAAEAATKAVEQYNSNPNEHMKKLMDEAKANAESMASLAKEVQTSKAQVEMLNGQLVKLAAHKGEVSLADLGAGKSELACEKAKIYRGMITNNWLGADKEKAVMDAVRQKAMEAGNDSAGGYVLPIEYSSNIVQIVRQLNVLNALGVMPINPTRFKFEVPVVKTGVTANFVGEASTIPDSAMSFGLLSLTPKKIAVIAYASREMIDAADPAIVQIIENDMANAIAEKQMWAALYGNNAANTPLGLANVVGIKTYAVDASGDNPSKSVFRAIRAQVDQKYNANPSFAFLMNENVALKAADLMSTAAPETSTLLEDEKLIRNACGKPYFTTGVVKADKTKTTANLGDVFYGAWNEFISATWWGGLRMDSTTVGGNAFAQDLYGFKTILPYDCAPRRAEQFVHAGFVKSINS